MSFVFPMKCFIAVTCNIICIYSKELIARNGHFDRSALRAVMDLTHKSNSVELKFALQNKKKGGRDFEA